MIDHEEAQRVEELFTAWVVHAYLLEYSKFQKKKIVPATDR